MTNNKCIYRLRIEELENENRPIPPTWDRCISCNGYSSVFICSDYVDLQHLIHFQGLRLNKSLEK